MTKRTALTRLKKRYGEPTQHALRRGYANYHWVAIDTADLENVLGVPGERLQDYLEMPYTRWMGNRWVAWTYDNSTLYLA